MDDEEDWDAPDPPKSPPKSSTTEQSNTNTSTPHQTLKITDGYKYSYEAHSSPANIDDWVEPVSYGGSRRSLNGYSQNSFRDNNRSMRNDKNDSNKRFNSVRRSDNFSNDGSPRNFGTPKSSRFPNRSLPTPVQDWDAPSTSSNQLNGSWKVKTPVSSNVEEDWDAVADTTSQNHKSTPKTVDVPMYNQNTTNNVNEEEDWDSPTGVSKKDKPLTKEIPIFKPDSSFDTPAHSSSQSHTKESSKPSNNSMEEEDWDEPSGVASKNKSTSQAEIPFYTPDNSMNNSTGLDNLDKDWDADPSAQSTSNTSGNGFVKEVPMYKPNNTNGEPFSSNPFSQRFENKFHSNKYPHSRGFESNDRFNRDPYSRHSRGNTRHNPYERNNRGFRGSRGGRGGRGSRDGPYQSPFNSRDNSRNRGDRERGDRPYQSSFNKNKNNDRSPYQQPSFNTTVVEAEEDWDSPTGFAEKPTHNTAPPIAAPPAEKAVEESWDDD